MKCNEVVEQFPLYSYGEVSSELEEVIEAHLADCVNCEQEFAKHRSFLDVLDQRIDVTEATLLTSCRADFRRQLTAESTRKARRERLG